MKNDKYTYYMWEINDEKKGIRETFATGLLNGSFRQHMKHAKECFPTVPVSCLSCLGEMSMWELEKAALIFGKSGD